MKIEDVLKLGENATDFGVEIFDADFTERVKEYVKKRTNIVLLAYTEYLTNKDVLDMIAYETLLEVLSETRRNDLFEKRHATEKVLGAEIETTFTIDIPSIVNEKVELPIHEGNLSGIIEDIARNAELTF
jgi:hypothetical protein